MSHNNQITGRLQQLRNFQPSIIRNSLLMILLQLFSFVGGIILVAISIWKLTINYPVTSPELIDLDALTRFNLNLVDENNRLLVQTNQLIAYYLLAGAVLLFLVWKLTRMVIVRNSYILELNDVLDDGGQSNN